MNFIIKEELERIREEYTKGTRVELTKMNDPYYIIFSGKIQLVFILKSCNLTNTNLLTIGKHYTLTGSSAFLHFGVSEA